MGSSGSKLGSFRRQELSQKVAMGVVVAMIPGHVNLKQVRSCTAGAGAWARGHCGFDF